jgi:hypothetical protein
VLLWAWLCPAIATLVRMMMVGMLVRLLPLLPGCPLLPRRRAAILRKGGDCRCQDDAGETHTKKCANQASLRCHIRSPCHNRQMRPQVLGDATGGHPCDGTPVSRPLRPRQGI